MKRIRNFAVLLALLVLCTAMSSAPRPWLKVRDGKLYGISGMVLLSESRKDATLLIAHDNKRDGQGRIALVTVKQRSMLTFSPLEWPGESLPYDIEAMSPVPGTDDEFMVCTSGGDVSHIKLDLKAMKLALIKQFKVPTAGNRHNYESFVLHTRDGETVAAWAHRGSGKKPAVLFVGSMNIKTGKIDKPQSTDISIPWPTGPVRHISDLVITPDGRVYASAASDPGDDGPFTCAIYEIGAIVKGEAGMPLFAPTEPRSVYRGPDNKAEALIIIGEDGKRFAIGSDDENMGSSLYISWL